MEKHTGGNHKATFVEVFGSIKFNSEKVGKPVGRWPQPGFAVNKSVHAGDAASEDQKQLVRSSN